VEDKWEKILEGLGGGDKHFAFTNGIIIFETKEHKVFF
jgi:hypothetical protein